MSRSTLPSSLKNAITIGPPQESDFEEWSALWKPYQTLPREQYEWTWKQMQDPNGEIRGLVARNTDGQLVGLTHYLFHASSWSMHKICIMNDIFVAEECRGQGLGQALIEATVEQAKLKGAIHLRWITRPDNLAAQKLYDEVAKSDFKFYNIKLGDLH